MSNDPRDLSGARLQQALQLLGRNPELRAELMQWLLRAEDKIVYPGGAIRDDITGPIVDALHTDLDVYERELADGTKFKFFFRTKIARDFLMAKREHPSHVWEPQTTKLLLKLAQEGRQDVLVGGAYFGDQAILLARQIQPQGRRLHGFEPNTAQADMFAENARINHLDNVEVRRLGLWSASSVKLKLDGFDSFANAVLAEGDEAGFQTITIDDYLAQQGRSLSLIQLDIEGAEFGALQGAQKCLAQQCPDIVFEVHRSYVDWSQGLENTELCRYLSGFGYHLFAIRDFNSHREMGDSPVELVPADQVYLEGPPHGFNMLAIRDVARLQAPFYAIVPGVSPKLLLHKDPALHHPGGGLRSE